VRRAFSVATSGRPGPVVLDVPEDVAHAEHTFVAADFFVDEATTSVPARRIRPDSAAIDRAANLLAAAKRPLILAGGGVHLSGAHAVLQQLAEIHGIPVAHTLSGKGAIPCVHDLSVGLFGRYSRYANELIDSSDCILAVGCKLGEIATKRYALPPSTAPLIHLDIVAEEIGRWAPTEVGLWGDVRAGLSDLHAALTELRPTHDNVRYLSEIRGRRDAWIDEAGPRYDSEEQPINMGRVVGELNRLVPEHGIVVADGGFASHWVGLLYDTKRAGRGFVADRGFASIGYGLPGALGVALAVRAAGIDAPVVALTGDGGLNMTIGDLETARRAGVPFTLIVINNAASGYIKALQHAVYGPGAYQSCDLVEIDYAALARGFGCHGHRVDDPAKLGPVLKLALETRDAPTVVDVVVTRDPAQMLPGVDSRTMRVEAGDRPA
jgi:acetolactate synthase-1/2/3 large subunit